jgi:hypothetical protein
MVAPPAAGEAARDPVTATPAAAPVGGDPATPRPPPPPAGYVRPKYVTWARLLERTFALDILACPDCGGRLRLVSTITDTPARGFRRAGSSVIDKILSHLGLPTEAPRPAPAKVAGFPGSDQVKQLDYLT